MTTNRELAVSHLIRPTSPWILGLSSDVSDSVRMEFALADLGVTARILNGPRMRTDNALFKEFATRLEFPSYFGENWDALDECLADLSWLPGFAYAIVIAQARYVLDREQDTRIKIFLRLIERVSEEWATPVDLGESWDRPAIPFHFILHESPDRFPALQADLRAFGMDLPLLSLDLNPDPAG